MDFFFLSKALWFFFNPINILLFLLLIGIIFHFFNKKKLYKIINIITLILFILIVILPTGPYLFWKLESSYSIPRTFPHDIDGILILGGGVNESLTYQHQQISLNEHVERLTESIDLMRRFPNAKIVFSGGIATLSKPKLTGIDIAKMFYNRMRVDINRIIFENKSRNTYENFVFSKKFIDNKNNEKWLLVTSAFHMKRAMNVAEKLELNFISYPVDFRLGKDFSFKNWYYENYYANISYFYFAAHEYIGLIAYYLTGKSSKIY